jgi:cell division septation protein DedD
MTPAAPAAVTSRPVTTVPVTQTPAQPRQIAMAQPAAPMAPAPARPAPAGPQVATVTGASGAFGVQLTAQRSEAEAMAAFNALKQRYPQVLGAYSATVARADLGSERGVF